MNLILFCRMERLLKVVVEGYVVGAHRNLVYSFKFCPSTGTHRGRGKGAEGFGLVFHVNRPLLYCW